MEGVSPTRRDRLYGIGDHEVECDVFALRGYLLVHRTWKRVADLLSVNVYVPVRPGDLASDVVVGREVLNGVAMTLDGSTLAVR